MEREGTIILTASVLSISNFGSFSEYNVSHGQFIIVVMGIIPMDTLTI